MKNQETRGRGDSCRGACVGLLMALLAAVAPIAAPAAGGPPAIVVNLPAEPLADALQALAAQAKLQILFEKSAVSGLTAPSVQGTLTAPQALDRLLRGTSLEWVHASDGAIVVRRRAADPVRPARPSTADAAPPAAAATGIEEVIVTATRRKERAQDIPMSVLALTQDALDARGARSIDDLSRLSPGVTFTRNGTAGVSNYNDESSDISIRGIDSSAGTSTTGIYIDDTPIQSRHIGFGTLNAFPALFDLDRVEVLRGPQGTLFGAGAEGGAVRFITPDPDLHDPSAYVRSEVAATRHGDPSYEFGAAAGGPIQSDALGFRISASYRRDGGFVDRVNYLTRQPVESASNWMDTATVRAALKWAVTDRVTVTPSILYQRLYLNDTAAYWPELSDPGSAIFRNGNAQSNPSTDPFYLAAIKATWDLDPVRLTNSLSYYSRAQHSVSDYTQFDRTAYLLIPTYGPRPPAGDAGSAYFEDHQNNVYEELRAESRDPTARLTWTAGLF